ncbi:MAG: undecaprenyl-diphosphate phosphatase [Acidobacteriaceae bacterium]
MNPYILSIVLGIIEGLTEFLPVSSTAHLRIAEALLGIDLGSGYWKMYSIVIQLGAILVLPIFFRARISKFVSTFPNGERGNRTMLTHPLSLVMIAFVCTAGPAFLLTKVIGKHLESLYIMGSALLIGGIVMWIVDTMFADRFRVDHMEQMSLGQSVWIGLCQILSAVFPGTSRSMSTIAAGQISGMSRASALEFSFFLSIPTMVVATLYDLLKTLHPKHMEGAEAIAPLHVDAHGWITLLIGFIVSFVVAYGVVAWFMNWVRTRGFAPFAIYRIVVGSAVLLWAFKGANW